MQSERPARNELKFNLPGLVHEVNNEASEDCREQVGLLLRA